MASKRQLLALGFLWPFALPAQIPAELDFQGRLTTPNGLPVSDGLHAVDFSLYQVPIAGGPLWSESHIVTTSGGIFTAILGRDTPLSSLGFDQQYFLGIAVESDPEMVPRFALTSAAYAINADRLDGFDAGDFLSTAGGTLTGSLVIGSGYLQLPAISGAPNGADCDAANEAGRLLARVDGPPHLYVCSGAAGWVGL